jgi:hypothetical protein
MFTNVHQAIKLSDYGRLKNTILSTTDSDFSKNALAVFQLQAEHNPVYRRWIELLGLKASSIKTLEDIPFMPIDFFKSQAVSLYSDLPSSQFLSSGTGGYGASKHLVYDLDFYDTVCRNIFRDFYPQKEEFFIAALLPSYLERSGSSLIRMAQDFINHSPDQDSGFFLDNLEELSTILALKKKANIPILLLGVSFALLDLAEAHPQNLEGAIVMETGGMKGRRKEMIRGDLHAILQSSFCVKQVHSEYGMTELFSQAYSNGAGLFKAPPWMRMVARQLEDPFSVVKEGRTGALNIIDLANIDSCAFIETQDLGRVNTDGSFEVLGRFDRAEVRGCNLMIS